MRRGLLAICTLSVTICCGLNPQPLPPEDLAALNDASTSDAAAPFPGSDSGANRDSGASPDASVLDASLGDAGDAGDASRDADNDGG